MVMSPLSSSRSADSPQASGGELPPLSPLSGSTRCSPKEASKRWSSKETVSTRYFSNEAGSERLGSKETRWSSKEANAAQTYTEGQLEEHDPLSPHSPQTPTTPLTPQTPATPHVPYDNGYRNLQRTCAAPESLFVDRPRPFGQEKLGKWARRAAREARTWDPWQFQFVRKLQDAVTNQGSVDLMQALSSGGMNVAVKRMPSSWVCAGPAEFQFVNGDTVEQPWSDLGITRFLNQIRFPFACQLHGVFHDRRTTYVVSEFATEGDLFSWVDRADSAGLAYEAEIRPISLQIFAAVRCLHELGIAHRDLSIENILLTKVADGQLAVKIIDFGAATAVRMCNHGGLRGKKAYQAPEMHLGAYDAFAVDNFALGVVLFATAAQDYPWSSTEPGSCVCYDFCRIEGLKAFAKARRSRKLPESSLADVLSPGLLDTLEGLLEEDPDSRMNIGETRWRGGERASFWDSAWVREAAP